MGPDPETNEEGLTTGGGRAGGEWPGWCCSYCSGPLHPEGHGLLCDREGRWFATLDGVHRLLDDQRRRQLLPALEADRRFRRDEGREGRWSALGRALDLARRRLGPGPWRVLDAGAGSGWAALRLLEDGHDVVAVDVDLDARDGLLAPSRLLDDPARLPRAEADLEALPLEPAGMDLVLAAGVLHHASRPARALLELRRVTRRGGLLVVIDSPVYRRAADGERMAAERAAARQRRYGASLPSLGPGYLVLGELAGLFEGAGWRLEVHGWPPRLLEAPGDVLARLRHGGRRPRYPVLVGRRDG